jgi:16S rRNA (guanine1207-N2)-methyltransferase
MTDPRFALALSSAELALPRDASVLVLNAQGDLPYAALTRDGATTFVTPHKGAADRLAARGLATRQTADGTYDAALVHITRSKAETLGLIAEAIARTKAGGVVMVDGSKTDGIESVRTKLAALVTLDGALSKAHGKLLWFSRPAAPAPEFADWTHEAEARATAEGFLTAPGLFSADAVDPGSALLAEQFDARLGGVVADLGAGWGYLSGEALKRGKITRIDLVEADRRALDAAAQNLNDPRARFLWEDATSFREKEAYDAVIANPPFHPGRAADPGLGVAFIATAARILKPGGSFLMVANRQLPYEPALDSHFAEWSILLETPRYKIVRASKPRHAAARAQGKVRTVQRRRRS